MIEILKENKVNELYNLLRASKSRPEGLNPSYMWEATQTGMLGIFYSENFESVFYGFAVKNGFCLESWREGNDLVEAVKSLRKKFGGEIIIGFDNARTGKALGLKPLNEKALEMKLNNACFADAETDFVAGMKEKAVSLLSQEWWTKEQAEGFIEATLKNNNGVSKIILDKEKTVAFAHAAYFGERAWINAVYVDKNSRGKGLGERINKAILGKLETRGIKEIFLGVDEANKTAISLYKKLGFNFTGFKKCQFTAST
jgi:ribosomal protein S18 acetylase RimI-like enzyme